ncbi:MAG: flagellar basal body P-ring formation chaperone FlgA [Thermodesulfobacteriota bacterium]
MTQPEGRGWVGRGLQGTLMILALVVGMAGAGLATEPVLLGDTELSALFLELAGAGAPWPAKRVVLRSFAASPPEVRLPAGPYETRLLNQAHPEHLGAKTLHVLFLQDGEEKARARLTGDLDLLAEVVVARRDLPRDTVLAAGDITVATRPSAAAGAAALEPAAVVGLRLGRALRQGEVVPADSLDKPPLVARGDRVTIVAASGGIVVKATGEVREAGAAGDRVRVQNLGSRREILAEVVDSRTVRSAL